MNDLEFYLTLRCARCDFIGLADGVTPAGTSTVAFIDIGDGIALHVGDGEHVGAVRSKFSCGTRRSALGAAGASRRRRGRVVA